jgi:hypothetical protein
MRALTIPGGRKIDGVSRMEKEISGMTYRWCQSYREEKISMRKIDGVSRMEKEISGMTYRWCQSYREEKISGMTRGRPEALHAFGEVLFSKNLDLPGKVIFDIQSQSYASLLLVYDRLEIVAEFEIDRRSLSTPAQARPHYSEEHLSATGVCWIGVRTRLQE